MTVLAIANAGLGLPEANEEILVSRFPGQDAETRVVASYKKFMERATPERKAPKTCYIQDVVSGLIKIKVEIPE